LSLTESASGCIVIYRSYADGSFQYYYDPIASAGLIYATVKRWVPSYLHSNYKLYHYTDGTTKASDAPDFVWRPDEEIDFVENLVHLIEIRPDFTRHPIENFALGRIAIRNKVYDRLSRGTNSGGVNVSGNGTENFRDITLYGCDLLDADSGLYPRASMLAALQDDLSLIYPIEDTSEDNEEPELIYDYDYCIVPFVGQNHSEFESSNAKYRPFCIPEGFEIVVQALGTMRIPAAVSTGSGSNSNTSTGTGSLDKKIYPTGWSSAWVYAHVPTASPENPEQEVTSMKKRFMSVKTASSAGIRLIAQGYGSYHAALGTDHELYVTGGSCPVEDIEPQPCSGSGSGTSTAGGTF